MGGAILLKSKTSRQNGLSLNPSFTIGSFGLKKYNVNSEYDFNGNNISIGTYLTESDVFRDHSDALFYGINLLSNLKIAQGFKLSTIVNYYSSPYLLNPGTLNRSDADNNPESVRNPILTFASAKKVEQVQGGIKLNYDLSKKSKTRTVIYSALRYLDNSIPGRIIDLKKILWGIRTEYENKIDLFNRTFYLLSGLDYEIQTDARQEFLNGGIDDPSNINPSTIFSEIKYSDQLLNQNENVKGLGLFSHINFNLTEKIKLFTGIRYDDFRFKVEDKIGKENNNYPNNIKMNNLSFMAGLNYQLNNFITTYCNYSTGFQTPTANELSNNPFYEGGFNTSLRPEFVRNYELGMKNWTNNQELFSQIILYFMDFSDLLISYQSKDEETFYRNAGKANNFGFEALIEYYPTEKLKIYASYGFMNFMFKDYLLEEEINGIKEMFQLSGNSIPGVPKNSFNTFLQYMFTNNIFCKLELSFTDKYYTNDFNGPLTGSTIKEEEFINESFLKINLQTVYNFDIGFTNIVIRLKVENLLNERYNQSIVPNAFGNNFFEPSPGRSFYFNISATI
jgi:iron complex outermembrane receptor protein